MNAVDIALTILLWTGAFALFGYAAVLNLRSNKK